MEIVDALRVYRAEEETLGGWAEPLMAFLLGLYKLIALIIKLDVTAFSPTSTDFISFLLYNTWYGLDYILGVFNYQWRYFRIS